MSPFSFHDARPLHHDRLGVDPTLIRGTLVAALGGLLFGFDTAVISGTTAALRIEYGLDDFTLGFTVASALIGTIFGPLMAGGTADRLGRRPTLLAIAVLDLVSAIGCAAAWDWVSLLLFRFVGGVGVGGASVVAPLYIAEIAPARWRGRLVAITQFQVVAEILLAFSSNYIIVIGFKKTIAWRRMFGVEAVPALAGAIAAFNQFSGINPVMYYAPDIFRMPGPATTPLCSKRWRSRDSTSSSPWRR